MLHALSMIMTLGLMVGTLWFVAHTIREAVGSVLDAMAGDAHRSAIPVRPNYAVRPLAARHLPARQFRVAA